MAVVLLFITLLVIYMQLLLIGSCTPVYDFTSYTHATFMAVVILYDIIIISVYNIIYNKIPK